MPIISGAISSRVGLEIGYDQITASVNITGTTEAAPNTVITCAAHVFDGQPVLLTVFSPSITTDSVAGDVVGIALWEGASELGAIGLMRTAQNVTADFHPFTAMFRFTPTAASHTYLIRCWASATTGTPLFGAGAGGVTTLIPAFARFTKV